MPFGFRFGERDHALFKKKYVTLFWLWESWRRNASLQGLPDYGKSRKKSVNVRTFFLQVQYRLYFNDINHIYSLNWCKCLQDICIHRKQFSERTIMTVMNVNMNAVLQTWQCFLFDSYFCLRFNLFFLLMVVVRCVLARLDILLVRYPLCPVILTW